MAHLVRITDGRQAGRGSRKSKLVTHQDWTDYFFFAGGGF